MFLDKITKQQLMYWFVNDYTFNAQYNLFHNNKIDYLRQLFANQWLISHTTDN
jgi:hypothetical protein